MKEGCQRFLCDEMLHRLGRYLRMAGYDTLFTAKGEHDNEVLRRAEQEDRWLLTCDTKIFTHSYKWSKIFLLTASDLEDQTDLVTRHFALKWSERAFTRCTIDNTQLVQATIEQVEKVPSAARKLEGPILYCPGCERLYWRGSHFEKMWEQLCELDYRASHPVTRREPPR